MHPAGFNIFVYRFLFCAGILTVQVTEAASTSGQCPRGFSRADQTCYKHLAQRATWLEARGYCDAMGTELVSVMTSEDARRLEEYLRSVILNSNVTVTTTTASPGAIVNPTPGPFSRYIWMLGSDHFEEGSFVWMNKEHRDVTYAKWAPGQPMTSSFEQAVCMAMDVNQSFQWTAMACSQHVDYVCATSVRNFDGPIVG